MGASHECVTDETVITGESAENSDDHGTWAAALGDVNGDGIADFGVIAERNSAGMVAIYLGVQDSGPDLSSPNVRIVARSVADKSVAFAKLDRTRQCEEFRRAITLGEMALLDTGHVPTGRVPRVESVRK